MKTIAASRRRGFIFRCTAPRPGTRRPGPPSTCALENRLETAQVHRSSVKTCGSKRILTRMEACSLCSLSCIDAGRLPVRGNLLSTIPLRGPVNAPMTSSTVGSTSMYSLQKELGFGLHQSATERSATYSFVASDTMPLSFSSARVLRRHARADRQAREDGVLGDGPVARSSLARSPRLRVRRKWTSLAPSCGWLRSIFFGHPHIVALEPL